MQTASSWFQRSFTLSSHSRGCYLITDEILSNVPEIKNFEIGLFHLFLQHTSASLSLNENYDPDVQYDMEKTLSKIVPEGKPIFYFVSAFFFFTIILMFIFF